MTPGSKPFTPEFDATLRDRDLAKARQDIAIGRWQGLPELLHSTGHDWDRRTHRVRLLAQSTAGTTIAEEWHTARPGDPDALVLRADTEVLRCFNLAVAAGTLALPARTGWTWPYGPAFARPTHILTTLCPGYRSSPSPGYTRVGTANSTTGGRS